MVVRQDLPPEIVRLLEERVNRRGALTLWASTPKPGEEAKTKPFYHTFKPEGSGESRKAYVYGSRLKEKSLSRTLVNGIAAAPIQGGPKVMALAEPRIRTLEIGERPDPTKAMVATCPISGETTPVDTNSPPPISNETPAFEDEDTVHYVCSGGHIGIHSTALMDAETKAHWANLTKRSATAAMDDNGTAGEGGTGGPIVPGEVPTTWTTGVRKVLYMRVAFPDRPQDPQSEASIIEVMRQVSDEVTAMSYGRTYMQATVTPLLMLSRTHDWLTRYEDDNGDAVGIIYSEARELAKALGYDTDQYDLDVVRWNGSVGDFGGSAAVGGKYFSDKAGNKGTCLHEFGHNFGLLHSNAWKGNPPSVIGPGYSFEYACYWDYMGAGSQEADGHYVAPTKAQLGWLPRESQALAQSSGTFRIFQTDQALQDPAKRYVLRARKDRDRDYWFEFRPTLVPGNPWLSNGLLVTHDSWGTGGIGGSGADLATGTNNGPVTLDMNPGTWRPNMTDTRRDSALTVGRTYTDTETSMHVTPVAKNATTPPSMDVTVNFGSPSANAPTQTLNASATSVGTGVTVNFTSTASDLDGDTLAYAWDFGDGTISTDNLSTQAKSWSAVGHYVVRCIVSDMKGSVNTAKVLITVGSPTTFTISGRVLGPSSVPLEGVQVANQVIDLPSNTYFTNNGFSNPQAANYRSGFTDSNGDYIITGVPAGSHTLYANLYPYSFTPTFGNPVSVAANVTGADWTGADMPTLTLAATDASATEVSADTGTFRITRSGDTTNALQVQVFNYSGTATLTSDYAVSPSTTNTSGAYYLTIPASSAFVDVTLTPVNDSASEGIETVTLTLPNIAAGYRISGANEASITIVDDESTLPVVSLTSNETIASEPSDAATLTLTRTGSTAAELIVSLSYTGTATHGTDYTAAVSVSIPAGQASTTFMISPSNDAAAEGTETIIVSLATNAAYQRANGVSALTFDLNDDDINTVSIAATDATASEAGDPGEFTITRSGSDLSQSLIVDYSVNGSAIHGKDFARLEGRAFIPAGETTATLRISPFNDTIGEGSQTVTLTLRSDGRYLVGSTQSASVTITDDDVSSFYTRTTQTHRDEPTSSSASATTFQIFRQGTGAAATVNYTVTGTATSGVDYTALSGSVSFNTSDTSKDISLAVLADADIEDAETVTVTLTPGAGYQLAAFDTASTAIILDADQPQVSVSAASAALTPPSVAESATELRFFVSRNTNPATTLTVNYTLSGTATSGSDYTGATGSVTIPASAYGEYITLVPTNDTAAEGTESVTLNVTPASGTYGLRTASATILLTDNDAFAGGAPSVAFNSASSTVSETGGSLNIPVTLTGTPGAPVTVRYAISGGTADLSDVLLPAGTLTFNAAGTQNLVLTALSDVFPETSETVELTLNHAYGATLGTATHVVTLTDVSQPEAFTDSPTAVLATAATVNGGAIPHGAASTAYFEWGTSTTYGNTTASQNIGAGQTEVAVAQELTGLATGQTYHYRLVATNANGTSYGNDRILTTTTQPAPVTLAASNRTISSATLNATVNPNTVATNAWFEWGTTTAYGNTTATQALGSGGANVAINAGITSLTEGTTYHYRVAAENGDATVYGENQSFVASPYEVAGSLYVNVRANHASAASASWTNLASLGGSFTEQGDTTLDASVRGTGVPGVLFDGNTMAYVGPESVEDIDGSGDRTVEAWVYNPACEGSEEVFVNMGRRDTQSYGVFALNYQRNTSYGAHIDWGNHTGWGSAVPQTGGWRHIVVTYSGPSLKIYVDGVLTIDKSLGYTLNTLRNAISIGSQLTSAGVPASSSYRYSGYINSVRIHGGVLTDSQVAANFARGPDQNTAAPTIANTGASAITTTGATLSASVNPQGLATTAYFEWGTSAAYGNVTATQNLAATGRPVAITAPITGLTPGQTIHFRVVATNGSGTTNGANTTFKPSAYANAGIVYVDLRATDASAGTATWDNVGAVGDFVENGNAVPTLDALSTGIPAVQFDRSTAAYAGPVSVPDIDENSDRSFEVWFYNPSDNGTEALFSQGHTGTARRMADIRHSSNSSNGAANHWADDLGYTTTPTHGAWHHVAYVYDGLRGVKIYTDGVLNSSKTLSADLNTFVEAMALACDRDGSSALNPSGSGLSGFINSVRVHGGQLSAEQAAANFALGPNLSSNGPTVVTQSTTFLLKDRATLNATVTPNGSATTVYFEYGTSASYGSQTAPQNITGPLASQTISATLTGLITGTTYHFRTVTTNADGTIYGDDQTFTPSPLVSAGTLYVNLRASNGSAATATWANTGSLSDFTEVGDTTAATNVSGTGIPGVQFNGTTTAYNGPNTVADISGASDRSIEAWVFNPAGENSEETIVNFGRQGFTSNLLLAFCVGSSRALHTWVDTANWTTVPSYGQWHHVASVSNGGTSVKFYVDGALQFTKTLSGTFNTETLPIAIGSSRNSSSTNSWGSFGFSGYLNTVRIHGGQLSDSDIARNYQYGPAVNGLPEVTTFAATQILADRFTASGEVDPSGLATSAWIEYGPTTAYGSQSAATSIGATEAPARLSFLVSGVSGTTYHYRVVAQNASGTAYGEDIAVTPAPLAEAGTLYVDISATQSGAGTATWQNLGTLGGNFSQIGTPALATNVVSTNIPGVELDGSSSGYYGPTSPTDISGASDRTVEVWAYNPSVGSVEVMVDIGRYTGTARTTYTASAGRVHYLTNEDVFWGGGTPAGGAWHHLVYVYDGATNVKAYVDGVLNTNATIGGVLATTAGAQISLGGIRVGTGNTQLQWAGGFGFSGYINRVRIHGGQLDATQVARNFAAGPAVPLPPTVVTEAADALVAAGGTLHGTVHPTGLATDAWFQYGTTSSYGTSTTAQSIGSGTSGIAVTQAITELMPNTLYHYRVVAQNSAGTTHGGDLTFTTDNVGLASISLSSGTLSPAFNTGTLSYNVTVSNATTELTVTPAANANGSTITVNGTSPTTPVALTVGTNTITVVVTNNGSRTYTLTVKRETPFETFLTENAATGANTGPSDDFDGDGVANLLEYAFGSNPGSNSSGAGLLVYSGTFAGGGTVTGTGKPAVAFESTPTGVDYRALFVRRKDHATVGLTYQVKFSANMTTWQTSIVTPTVLADDGTYQVVSVPYPNFVAGRKARFFTVTVSTAP